MVTYGARLDANALIQMRVHDVNVLTDLTALDPDEPVDDDGTVDGSIESAQQSCTGDLETSLDTQMASITFYWTVVWFWPRLVGEFAGGLCGDLLTVAVSVDLLGNFEIETLSYDTPLDDSLSESEKQALQTDMPDPVEDLGGPLGIRGALVAGYWVLLEFAMSFGVLSMTGPQAWVVVAAVIGLIAFWGAWLVAIDIDVSKGVVSLAEARSLTANFVFALAFETVAYALLCAYAVHHLKEHFEKASQFLHKMKELATTWGVVSFAVKLGVLILTFLMYAKYYNMAVQEYLDSR